MADVDAGGVRLHVQRLGEREIPPGGEPAAIAVAFVHGLVMDNLASWFFTVANAAAQHAEVVLYDLRGHGKSARPETGYGLPAMVGDLDAVLRATVFASPRQARRVVLVGNSFGGLLAVAYARAFPAEVAGLVLVDAHLGDAGFGDAMAATLGLEGEARDRQIAESFKHWLGRHSEKKRTRLADAAGALIEGTSLVADLKATPPVGAGDLAGLEAPVLALYGENSDLRARSEALLAGVPRVELRIFEGCSHSILWEATESVRDAIVAFVAARAREGAS